MPSKGYFYIAYKQQRFLDEAQRSIESLRKVDKKATVAVLLDREPSKQFRALVDEVRVDQDLHPGSIKEGLIDNMFEGKLYNLYRTPFEHTFCVDTDTYFYENCSSLFNLMNYFDLAVCQSEGERTIFWPHCPHDAMRGLNVYTNGVMVYRRSEAMMRVFRKAVEYYQKNRMLYKYKGTNVHTTAAIAEDPDIKVYTLPINYNARVRSSLALTGLVKIAHSSSGRTKMTVEQFEEVRREINKYPGYRVWHPKKGITVG